MQIQMIQRLAATLPRPFRPAARPEAPDRVTLTGSVADLRPFIHGLRVVEEGSHPILGGTPSGFHALLPADLPVYPSQRWTVTPEIAAFHHAHFDHVPNAELRAEDARELEPTAGPLLARRCGERKDLTVVELGPATSTVVPRTFGNRVGRYFATDLSLPLLERERDLVTEPGYLIASAWQVQGDTYALPYESGMADFAFTSCHPPFVSSSPADRIQAFGEVARVLKPGGEFILFPWEPAQQHPAVAAFVDKNFEVVDRQESPLGREMVALRKRG